MVYGTPNFFELRIKPGRIKKKKILNYSEYMNFMDNYWMMSMSVNVALLKMHTNNFGLRSILFLAKQK